MPDQMPLFTIDEAALATCLTQLNAIEQEEDRLREEKRLLLAEWQAHLPIRAVRTALKVVRARQKLAEHAKEPLSYAQQDTLEAFVTTHLEALKRELDIPDLTGGTP